MNKEIPQSLSFESVSPAPFSHDQNPGNLSADIKRNNRKTLTGVAGMTAGAVLASGIGTAAQEQPSPLPEPEKNTIFMGVNMDINGNKQVELTEVVIKMPEIFQAASQRALDAAEELAKEVQVNQSEPSEDSQYSPDKLFSRGIKKITPNQIKRIINNESKPITTYVKEKYNPKYTVKDQVKFLNTLFNDFMKDTDFKANGIIIARQVSNMIADANKMKEKGYEEAAEAYMNVAHAFYRKGYTILKLNGQSVKPDVYNKLIKKSYDALIEENS